MRTYLYCVNKTFVGIVLADTKDEAKEKVSKQYINVSSIIVVDPLDRDIMIDDVYEIEDLFSYTSLKDNENRRMKETLKNISKLANEYLE